MFFSRPREEMKRDALLVLLVCAAAGFLAFWLLPLRQLPAALLLTAILGRLSLVDLREHLLPDALTLPLMLAGLVLALAGLGPSPLLAALGAAAGWTVLAALSVLYRAVRGHDGLGLGDAKLLGALGAWVGLYALAPLLLIAASLGLLYGLAAAISGTGIARRTEIPFGPFLSLAGWCVFIASASERQFAAL
jgi:leader peptidase (prepilin peptidase)/N-methyltransferase